eukprot:1364454-Amorphochlora_amoeboformis.AAC.1
METLHLTCNYLLSRTFPRSPSIMLVTRRLSMQVDQCYFLNTVHISPLKDSLCHFTLIWHMLNSYNVTAARSLTANMQIPEDKPADVPDAQRNLYDLLASAESAANKANSVSSLPINGEF